ncbi:MAG: hypothetical protein KatS3mg108_0317 [Isosphaeraceae bacterium]|jgi:hypothetical protein|nr:MAG: hypothetical protein KatS3mg108_0317 [Isosphaeraceae bacterium]
MRRVRPLWAILVLTALPAQAAELRIGAAQVDITPPVGIPMAGYYYVRPAESIHDPLYAKALVLDDGQTRAALVALDLISTSFDLVHDARKEIEATTGIPADHVMISATHAHTGPVIGTHAASGGFGGDHPLARRFRAELPAKIAQAVSQADQQRAPARLRAAHGSESSIAFNRRFHMADGSVGWNPGKLNPAILKPAGTIDPDVPVLFFDSADQPRKPLAAYVNYAVHLDNVGGTAISADLPAVLARLLADVHGPNLITLWTAGCCGDINHIDVTWPEPQHGHANAARMGTILAAEVLRTWPRLAEVPPGPLRVRRQIVSLDLPEVSDADVEAAQAILARVKDGSTPPPTFLEHVHAYKVLDVAARNGQPWEVEVQVIALGNSVAWVSLPGEIFVELGLAIKQDSPFPHTIIAELANGSIGYIPSRRAYNQGNYEVISARCAAGSGERLVDAAVQILKTLHHEASP